MCSVPTTAVDWRGSEHSAVERIEWGALDAIEPVSGPQ